MNQKKIKYSLLVGISAVVLFVAAFVAVPYYATNGGLNINPFASPPHNIGTITQKEGTNEMTVTFTLVDPENVTKVVFHNSGSTDANDIYGTVNFDPDHPFTETGNTGVFTVPIELSGVPDMQYTAYYNNGDTQLSQNRHIDSEEFIFNFPSVNKALTATCQQDNTVRIDVGYNLVDPATFTLESLTYQTSSDGITYSEPLPVIHDDVTGADYFELPAAFVDEALYYKVNINYSYEWAGTQYGSSSITDFTNGCKQRTTPTITASNICNPETDTIPFTFTYNEGNYGTFGSTAGDSITIKLDGVTQKVITNLSDATFNLPNLFEDQMGDYTVVIHRDGHDYTQTLSHYSGCKVRQAPTFTPSQNTCVEGENPSFTFAYDEGDYGVFDGAQGDTITIHQEGADDIVLDSVSDTFTLQDLFTDQQGQYTATMYIDGHTFPTQTFYYNGCKTRVVPTINQTPTGTCGQGNSFTVDFAYDLGDYTDATFLFTLDGVIIPTADLTFSGGHVSYTTTSDKFTDQMHEFSLVINYGDDLHADASGSAAGCKTREVPTINQIPTGICDPENSFTVDFAYDLGDYADATFVFTLDGVVIPTVDLTFGEGHVSYTTTSDKYLDETHTFSLAINYGDRLHANATGTAAGCKTREVPTINQTPTGICDPENSFTVDFAYDLGDYTDATFVFTLDGVVIPTVDLTFSDGHVSYTTTSDKYLDDTHTFSLAINYGDGLHADAAGTTAGCKTRDVPTIDQAPTGICGAENSLTVDFTYDLGNYDDATFVFTLDGVVIPTADLTFSDGHVSYTTTSNKYLDEIHTFSLAINYGDGLHAAAAGSAVGFKTREVPTIDQAPTGICGVENGLTVDFAYDLGNYDDATFVFTLDGVVIPTADLTFSDGHVSYSTTSDKFTDQMHSFSLEIQYGDGGSAVASGSVAGCKTRNVPTLDLVTGLCVGESDIPYTFTYDLLGYSEFAEGANITLNVPGSEPQTLTSGSFTLPNLVVGEEGTFEIDIEVNGQTFTYPYSYGGCAQPVELDPPTITPIAGICAPGEDIPYTFTYNPGGYGEFSEGDTITINTAGMDPQVLTSPTDSFVLPNILAGETGEFEAIVQIGQDSFPMTFTYEGCNVVPEEPVVNDGTAVCTDTTEVFTFDIMYDQTLYNVDNTDIALTIDGVVYDGDEYIDESGKVVFTLEDAVNKTYTYNIEFTSTDEVPAFEPITTSGTVDGCFVEPVVQPEPPVLVTPPTPKPVAVTPVSAPTQIVAPTPVSAPVVQASTPQEQKSIVYTGYEDSLFEQFVMFLQELFK